MNEQVCLNFGGSTYNPAIDGSRLSQQLRDVFNLMQDGTWRTLYEIEGITGHPAPSVSARLRDLRKHQFGGRTINRRRRKNGSLGTWEYQMEV